MLKTYQRLFELLDAGERRSFFLLFALILIMGLIDLLGVVSIFPFLSALAAPEIIETNPLLATAYDRLGFDNTDSFLYFLGGVAFALTVFGQAFKALTVYRLTRFAKLSEFRIGSRLLSRYLHQPYSWFLNRHSADLGRAILTEVGQVTHQSLMPALRMLAQGIVILFLILLLFAMHPLAATVSVVVLGGSYGLIFFLTRRYLTRIGADRVLANKERFRFAQEAVNGIKAVKLRGLEESYLARFRNAARRFSRHQASAAILGELPRYLLEGLVFGGLILLILVLISSTGGSLEQVIPIFGVFAIAGARIFPALQQVYAGFVALRFSKPALDALIDDLRDTALPAPVTEDKPSVRDELSLRDRLELNGIEFTYPGANRPSLSRLDLEIDANSTVGIVGSTGAGKTTLVDVILGLLTPQRGQVCTDGRVIDQRNVRDWQLMLGYVPQEIYLSDDTIAANIAFGVPPDQIDMEAVEQAARAAEMHDFVVNDQPKGYGSPIGERGVRLSGGQRQRIGIARALYHDPMLLVLDEATSALDNATERAVMDAVHNLGHQKTIVIIAHRLTTVRACDKIFLLERGTCVACGTYDELLESNDGFRTLARAAS